MILFGKYSRPCGGLRYLYHPYSTVLLLYILLTILGLLSRGSLKSVSTHSNKDPVSSADVGGRGPEVPHLSADQQDLLLKSFRLADLDNNQLVSQSELTSAIATQTRRHIMGAMRNNFKIFFSLDKKKRNGQVDWEEYYSHYVRTLLRLDDKTIQELETSPQTVSRPVKESIARLKAAWSEAAKSNPESVNIDEFLSLEHPESSQSLLITQVEELMSKYDEDSDGTLSRVEYIMDPYINLSQEEVKERERIFDTGLDLDKSGVADRREIIKFLDPKNEFWAREEAAGLMRRADRNADGHLSWQELLAASPIFLASKLVNVEQSFHAEF